MPKVLVGSVIGFIALLIILPQTLFSVDETQIANAPGARRNHPGAHQMSAPHMPVICTPSLVRTSAQRERLNAS